MSEQHQQWLAFAAMVAFVLIVAATIVFLLRLLRDDVENEPLRGAAASWAQEWVFDAHPQRETPDPMRDKRGIVRRAKGSVG